MTTYQVPTTATLELLELPDRRVEVRIANFAETNVWVEADEPIPAGVQYVRVTFKGPRAAIGFEARITGRDGRRLLLKIAARDTRVRAIFKRWARGQNVSLTALAAVT